jgi:hypothetical protein
MPTPGVAPTAESCELIPAPADTASSLVIAVTDPIDPPRAWSGPNAAARFIVSHAYETLVGVDCMGRVVPGLAHSWRQESDGRRWLFVLRDDVRFWSGEVVGPADVIATWREASAGSPDDPLMAVVESATVVDARTLALTLPDRDVARLADPAFAVRRLRADSPWPEGTGAFRVRGEAGNEGLRRDALRTTLHLDPVGTDARPRLTIHSVPATIARDLVDAGIDLLLTDAFDLVKYAAGRPEVRVLPLAWDRTYVLLTALESRDPATSRASAGAQARRDALALNVVGGDTRGATGPFWWSGTSSCSAAPRGARAIPSHLHVAHDRADPVARALAERVVAMAGMPSTRDDAGVLLPAPLRASSASLTTAGLVAGELARSLREGTDAAWIVGLPLDPHAPCFARARLVATAPWLALPDSGRIVPLIDTRLHALLRASRVGLAATGDGTPRLLFGGRKP